MTNTSERKSIIKVIYGTSIPTIPPNLSLSLSQFISYLSTADPIRLQNGYEECKSRRNVGVTHVSSTTKMAAGKVLESAIHKAAQKLGYEDIRAEQMKVVSSVVLVKTFLLFYLLDSERVSVFLCSCLCMICCILTCKFHHSCSYSIDSNYERSGMYYYHQWSMGSINVIIICDHLCKKRPYALFCKK